MPQMVAGEDGCMQYSIENDDALVAEFLFVYTWIPFGAVSGGDSIAQRLACNVQLQRGTVVNSTVREPTLLPQW